MLIAKSDPVQKGFQDPPNDSRLRMYWRIFGPAMQRTEIDYQLSLVKQAGLGGLVAYFMYPFALDDPAVGVINQRFCSPEFLDTFGYAAKRARELGLRLGINGGTGWPYGGPTVSVEDSAKKLVEVLVKPNSTAPTLGPHERLIAAFADGKLTNISEPHVGQELHLFIQKPTMRQVKRSALGGEGLEVDPWNRDALDRWLAANVEPILKATGHTIDTLGCDSLEVYEANWATDLPDVFHRRCGYDLVANLDAAYHDKTPVGDAVRFDYWRTLTELFEERFTIPLGAYCAKNKISLEMEAYGTPPSPMTAARAIQVPTGEHYEWRGLAVQKYVASAAHMAGRNIIGAEAWTWAGLPNRLADSLSDIKLVSDMTFLLGANDLTGVDFPYSPRSAGAPGWQPYYGPTFNQNNPQWLAFPEFATYLSRCQWMLRQGKPAVTVAVYLPVEDAFAHGGMDEMLLDFLIRDHFVTGKATSEFGLQNALTHYSALLRGLNKSGLDYDGIDFWAMSREAKVRRGRLEAGASSYRAIVLPNLETMDLDALAKVEAFCRAGGLAVASRGLPKRAAGSEARQAAHRAYLAKIFGDGVPGRPNVCGAGHGIVLANDEEVGPYLAAHVGSQISFSEPPETVGFVQRTLPDRTVTFFVNTDSKPATVSVTIPGLVKTAELWDPVTGATWLAESTNGIFGVALPARGSIFLVTGQFNGSASSSEPQRLTKAFSWTPKWHITFEGPDSPPGVDSRELRSWTEWPAGAFFSGTATYETTLDWPAHRRAVLELVGLREVANVKVNGKSVGAVWSPPYQLDIGKVLHPGSNKIEITVGNLPVNRFLGLPDPDLKGLRAKYGNRFQAPEEKQVMKQPPPSGITGKVRLLVE